MNGCPSRRKPRCSRLPGNWRSLHGQNPYSRCRRGNCRCQPRRAAASRPDRHRRTRPHHPGRRQLAFRCRRPPLHHPVPDWLSAADRLSPDVASLVEANYYSDPTQAFVEFFPRGKSLENWTTTYAARVTLTPGRSLEDYRRATIFGYSRTCEPDATGFFMFGEETADFFPALAFICGAYLDSIPDLKGKGEVMVSVFRKTDAGIAVIYQEWRGPAFGTYQPETWPVSSRGSRSPRQRAAGRSRTHGRD